jgi:hypothetical protein
MQQKGKSYSSYHMFLKVVYGMLRKMTKLFQTVVLIRRLYGRA